jgi:multisubunit Na+/H+ antiporter MnhB subunit
MARPSKRRRADATTGGSAPSSIPSSARPASSPSRPPGSTRPASSTPSRYRTQRVEVPRPWWQAPWAWGGAVTVVVVALVVVFIVLGTRPAAKSTSPSSSNPLAPASVLAAVTGVSPSVSSTIAAGGVADPLESISGSPAALTGPGSKPELFYLGAEFCPYCAAERWSVVIALSRFGTFTDLRTTTSSSTDVYPNTNTFSFYGSSYSSSYLDFAPIESADRNQNTLQTPTAAEQALVTTYDTSPYSTQAGGIPFQDLANRYIVSGSGASPEVLQGMTWQQIAGTLTDATSQVAKPIIGNANWVTAGICEVTGNQPGSVCSAAPIPSLESQLGSS